MQVDIHVYYHHLFIHVYIKVLFYCIYVLKKQQYISLISSNYR